MSDPDEQVIAFLSVAQAINYCSEKYIAHAANIMMGTPLPIGERELLDDALAIANELSELNDMLETEEDPPPSGDGGEPMPVSNVIKLRKVGT